MPKHKIKFESAHEAMPIVKKYGAGTVQKISEMLEKMPPLKKCSKSDFIKKIQLWELRRCLLEKQSDQGKSRT